MSQFANLMALSATQTKQQQSAVEMALRERQRKEALKRKQQEEREAKERELEKQRRLKIFEDQKREQERQKRLEEAKKAKELQLQRREEEQRDKLLYGPKKAVKMAASSSHSASDSKSKDSAPRRRRTSDDSDDDSQSGPTPLTREELRERKQKMEMKRLYGATKRSSTTSSGYHKSGRRLPGGAMDITTPSTSAAGRSGPGEHKSVKDRLTAMPNMLVKLNQVKRDTRTIDEILQDRAKAKEHKVLEGDEALVFDDWFGTKKKEKRQSPQATGSGANTPSAAKKVVPPAKPVAPPPPKPSASVSRISAHAAARPSAPMRPPATDKAKSTLPKINKSSHAEHHPSSSAKSSSAPAAKKRPRSTSRSESPPPQKRRHRSPDYEDHEDYSTEIWKLFGRDRNQYVSRDVMSDDEDMEADARVLEKEEAMSARIAQREEQLALEAERKHEEEKRRRKKERERAVARGGA